MKQINEYINQSVNEFSGNAFSEKVKYTKSDWDKWKKETKEDVLVGNYESDPDLEVVYVPNHKDKMMEHIGKYNKKTQTLYCDDIKIFGHEV